MDKVEEAPYILPFHFRLTTSPNSSPFYIKKLIQNPKTSRKLKKKKIYSKKCPCLAAWHVKTAWDQMILPIWCVDC